MSEPEITYTKKFDNGKTYERIASTPRDHVQLQFDGWTPKGETKNPPPAEAKAADSKPAK